jgi:putative membrane protein
MRNGEKRLALSAWLWGAVTVAHAHGDEKNQMLHWTWEPWFVVSILVVGGLYLAGCLRLSKESNLRKILGATRLASFAAGMLLLIVALASPLDALAGHLFSAHMTQHMLLMLVVPPLLVWGRPAFVWLWAFPLKPRRRIGRIWIGSAVLRTTHAFLMRPAVVWVAASAALWFWHIPGPYDWALSNEAVHAFEHLCFFVTSLALWTLTIEPYGPRRLGYGAALILVGTFALHNGLLGALLTFAPTTLYRTAAGRTAGLSPLEDQQLAGLIMWVPAGFIHLTAVALLFLGWLSNVKAYARVGTRRSIADLDVSH